jgi:hypothetical protein
LTVDEAINLVGKDDIKECLKKFKQINSALNNIKNKALISEMREIN